MTVKLVGGHVSVFVAGGLQATAVWIGVRREGRLIGFTRQGVRNQQCRRGGPTPATVYFHASSGAKGEGPESRYSARGKEVEK